MSVAILTLLWHSLPHGTHQKMIALQEETVVQGQVPQEPGEAIRRPMHISQLPSHCGRGPCQVEQFFLAGIRTQSKKQLFCQVVENKGNPKKAKNIQRGTGSGEVLWGDHQSKTMPSGPSGKGSIAQHPLLPPEAFRP